MTATAIPFRILGNGTEVLINTDFQKSMGFTRGEILGLCENVSVEKAIADGGTYRIRRLDGSEQDSDLIHDMHRTTFKPMTRSKVARKERRTN